MTTYRAALTEYGRPPLEFPIARECYVGSSHASAYAECKAALEYKYAAYAAWGMTSPLEGTSFDDFARDRFIIGDKESVKDEILRYARTAGGGPLHHAQPVAGAGAGQGAGVDPAAGGDFRRVARGVMPARGSGLRPDRGG